MKDNCSNEVSNEDNLGGARVIAYTIIISGALALIIGLWLIVYNLRSSQIDTEVSNMGVSQEDVDKLDEVTVKGITVKIDDKEYKDIQEFIGVITKPETGDCTVTYFDDKEEEKKCYVVFNTDTEVKEATYENNDVVKIILPAVNKKEE